MPDDSTPTSTPAAPTPPPADDVGSLPDWAQKLIRDTRTEAATHRTNAKENAAAAQKLAAIEEASKTEAQKAADKVAEYEQRATAAELKALRYEVGVEKGIPTKLLRYLSGATKDEIEANADQLIADFGPATGPEPTSSGRPREALRAGALPGATPDPTQAINDRIRQAARRS